MAKSSKSKIPTSGKNSAKHSASKKSSHSKHSKQKNLRSAAGSSAVALFDLTTTQWTPDEIKKSAIAVWDQTSPGTNCATSGSASPLPKEDCNCYIKNAARALISSLPFDDPAYDADMILSKLAVAGSGWTALGKDPDAAREQADKGSVVIAGMTSSELGEENGHLAFVVIGKEYSGTLKRDLPRCCAGALNAAARVSDRGIHFTFPVRKALDVKYFARKPNLTLPPSMLLVHLQEAVVPAAAAIDTRLKGMLQAEPPIDADPSHLLTDFRTKLNAALQALEAAGTPFKLVEGFRTTDRQQFLYGSGRPSAVPYGRPGPIVTNADGVTKRSKHQGDGSAGTGVAADCYPTKDGKIISPIPPSSDPVWTAYATAVKNQGLVAGQDFTSIKDSPHCELA